MKRKLLLLNWGAMAVKPLVHSLHIMGWEVVVGMEGGKQACQRAAEILPTAILIDLSLGATYGYTTGAAIYEDETTRHIPIIFLGGSDRVIQEAKMHVPHAIVTTVPELAELLTRLAAPAL